MIPFIENAKDEILAKINALKTTIDRLVTVSQGNNPNIALGNLTNKIDALKQDVGTKSKQETVNQVGQDLDKIGSTLASKIGTVEKAVNTKASQSSVNEVWQDLNDISKKITNKLGTVEGKIDRKASQSSLDELRDVVDATYSETAKEKVLSKLVETVNRGAVKSVQRGEISMGQHEYENNVTISRVNINKSIVLVQWKTESSSSSSYAHGFKAILTSPTNLKISKTYESLDGAWQVIEFY